MEQHSIRYRSASNVVILAVLAALLLQGSAMAQPGVNTRCTSVGRYYDAKGKAIVAALLASPLVDGTRISSGYGYRIHPISKQWEFHRGIDIAAPYGTPIFSVGDGVVIEASRKRSFGNYVRVRHDDSAYETAYAHLSQFAHGIHRGARVKRGQVIGNVGSSGLSSGPHVHYSLYVNGSSVRPVCTCTSALLAVNDGSKSITPPLARQRASALSSPKLLTRHIQSKKGA